MSISKLVALMLLVGITTAGMAQQQYSLDHFVGLKAEGTIPADLRKNLAEIYSEDKQRVRDYNDGKLTNRDRVLEVSYHISRLMNNGRILYGDPITRMVERIADTLLKDYPQLRSELRFYTVKSPAVNAFATGQGMIFVTTGLVAQAENESQLAYIISHEVIHYFRKHNMEMITRRVKNTDDEAGQMADFLLFHNRSREMEGEADSLGLTMFYLNSPYDKQVTEGVFDVLQYALLPFDEVPFDTLYFNSPYYKIPNHYYLAKVADITSRDDYDDSRSTHPNIKKRRAHTGEIISHQQGGSKYVVTTMQEFAHLRMLARFECIRQNLIYSNYTRAFYDSYVLSKQLPDNPFLRRSMVQALYGIAMVKTYRNTNEIVGDYHQQEGEIQQLYYLFGKLNSEEACLLAMREIWKYHLQFPNDPQAMAMGRDMMLTLRDRHHLSRNAFADTYTSAPSPGAVEKEQPEVNQKYARIRQKQQKSEAQNPTRFAFTDFMMQNGDFRKFMDDCLDAPQPQKPQPSAQLSTLLYAPQYLVVENKTDNPDVKYRKSDRMEKQLISDVQRAAKAAGLEVVDFSDPAMHTHDDAAFYNDFVTINEWTNEFWQNRGLVPMTLTSQPLMDDLNQRYGTGRLCLNTVVNSEYNPFLVNPLWITTSVLLLPTFPQLFYHIFSNRENTVTRNLLIDTRQGSVLSDQTLSHDFADSRSLVSSDIYTTLNRALSPKRVPGFLGRRLAVSANLGMSLPIMNRIFDRPGANFNFRPAVNLEWVTSSHNSVALCLDYNRTIFYNANGYSTTAAYQGWYDVDPLYNVSIPSAMLTYRHYLSNSTAPQGPYFGWGAIASQVNLTPQAQHVVVNRMDSTYYRFGISVESGRNYLVGNNLLLNIGIRYNLTAANPFTYDPMFDHDSSPQERQRKTAQIPIQQMNGNLWLTNLLILQVGIGFLPF